MCVYVNVSNPLLITLGVLFSIMQVSGLLGSFEKIDYFIQPHKYFHILCAQYNSRQHDILIPTYRSTMGNESQHTLHTNEIDEVFQK